MQCPLLLIFTEIHHRAVQALHLSSIPFCFFFIPDSPRRTRSFLFLSLYHLIFIAWLIYMAGETHFFSCLSHSPSYTELWNLITERGIRILGRRTPDAVIVDKGRRRRPRILLRTIKIIPLLGNVSIPAGRLRALQITE